MPDVNDYRVAYGLHPVAALDPVWDERSTFDDAHRHWRGLGFDSDIYVAHDGWDAERDDEAEVDAHGNYGPLPAPAAGWLRLAVWTNEDGETLVHDVLPVSAWARGLAAFAAAYGWAVRLTPEEPTVTPASS